MCFSYNAGRHVIKINKTIIINDKCNPDQQVILQSLFIKVSYISTLLLKFKSFPYIKIRLSKYKSKSNLYEYRE